MNIKSQTIVVCQKGPCGLSGYSTRNYEPAMTDNKMSTEKLAEILKGAANIIRCGCGNSRAVYKVKDYFREINLTQGEALGARFDMVEPGWVNVILHWKTSFMRYNEAMERCTRNLPKIGVGRKIENRVDINVLQPTLDICRERERCLNTGQVYKGIYGEGWVCRQTVDGGIDASAKGIVKGAANGFETTGKNAGQKKMGKPVNMIHPAGP